MNPNLEARVTPGRRLAIPGLACALLAACGTAPPAEEHEGSHSEDVASRVALTEAAWNTARIEVARVKRRPIEESLLVTGTLGYDERRLARVGAAGGGRILALPVLAGEAVRRGDVLAEIEGADLSGAVAAWRAARAETYLRRSEAERGRVLYEGKAISRADLLRRESDQARAEAALTAAAQQMAILDIAESEALRDPPGGARGVSRLRAPIAGTVSERLAAVGQVVPPGETLFVVADLARLWLTLQVFEKDLGFLSLGQEVEIRAAAWPEERFSGEVRSIGAVVDPHSRTIPLRVDITNTDGRLRPGMSVEATLLRAIPVRGVTIPASALTRMQGAAHVFVRSGEHSFEVRSVQTGRASEDWIEVVSGVSENEVIAVQGVFALKSEAMKSTLAEEH